MDGIPIHILGSSPGLFSSTGWLVLSFEFVDCEVDSVNRVIGVGRKFSG